MQKGFMCVCIQTTPRTILLSPHGTVNYSVIHTSTDAVTSHN